MKTNDQMEKAVSGSCLDKLATNSGDRYLDYEAAAERAGLAPKYFRNLYKRGMGPVAMKPSPNVTLFRPADIDAWAAGWEQRITPAGVRVRRRVK